MNYSYVTLLSSLNYLDAILVLNYSLQQVNSKYSLTVMITEEIYNDKLSILLQYNNIKFHIIKSLFYNKDCQEKYENLSVLNTASKLQIFELKQYDKIVYLDADMLVLTNIDYLFSYPDGAMLLEPVSKSGFSALFVIEPKNHNELQYYKIIIQNYNCLDGDLFSNLWFFVKNNKDYQIPSYFVQNADFKTLPETKIVHFCNAEKLWLYPQNYINSNLYHNKLYLKYLKNIREEKEYVNFLEQ